MWTSFPTSLHSSRMRTAYLLPVSPSMHCAGGVSAPGGGCLPLVPGGYPSMQWGRAPPFCEHNSWHRLLKILTCPNFVEGSNNNCWLVRGKLLDLLYFGIHGILTKGDRGNPGSMRLKFMSTIIANIANHVFLVMCQSTVKQDELFSQLHIHIYLH